MSDEPISINPVTVLNGHTSPETAHVVENYPNGGRRCTMRYWVETATKGAKKHQQRLMRQSTNPRQAGQVWNKPKPGNYYGLVVPYLDAENQHVKAHVMDAWSYPEDHVWARMVGLVDQLDEATRVRYDTLVRYSRGWPGMDTLWREYHERVDALAAHYRRTGEEPELPNGVLTLPTGAAKYIGTVHSRVLLRLARELTSLGDAPYSFDAALLVAYTPAGQVTCKHGRGLGDTCEGDPDTGVCKR